MAPLVVAGALALGLVPGTAAATASAPASVQVGYQPQGEDPWVLWGEYRLREECAAQGQYLVQNHADKWRQFQCLPDGSAQTPWQLWVMRRSTPPEPSSR